MNDDRRATRARSPEEPCLNCGDPSRGRFCPTCGQRKIEVLVSVRALLADVLEDQLVLNRALPRTLFALLFRPGFLTREYTRGRIVRYVAPFRLYLALSLLFFLLVSSLPRGFAESINVRGLPSDPDSIRTVLLSRQAALARADTVNPIARAAVQQIRADIAAALAALGDDPASVDSARLADILSRAYGDVPLPPGTRQPWAVSLGRSSLPPWLRPFREQKLQQIGHLPPRQALNIIVADMIRYAPYMVFLLLPFFALILKLLYVRRGRFYAEHFVFALHLHAFFFALFLLIFVSPWERLDQLLILGLMLYVWLAMKQFYRQGWFRTSVKWLTLGVTYFMLFTVGTLLLALVALLLP